MAPGLQPDTIRRAFRHWFVGQESSEGEQRAYCPVCEDPKESSSPSAMLNPVEDVWNCLKGGHGGKISELAKQLKAERGFDVRAEAMKGNRRAKGSKDVAPPSPLLVAQWHQDLLENDKVLSPFTSQRAISLDTIQEYEIGWDAQTRRYTIPVYDADGHLVNVRKYKMGAKNQEQKFLNLPGHGEARLFAVSELADTDWVVLAEGELDCLVLLERGFPAVSGTGGSKTFKSEWAEYFTDKTVYVAYDADKAGDDGAVKVTNVLRNWAAVVYRVRLPADTDVTDFFAAEGTEEEFEELLSRAKGAGARSSKSLDDIPKQGRRVSLLESMSPKDEGDPIELIVSVTGKGQEPFTAPRRVVATCDMSKGVACEVCPLMARNGQMEIETKPHDPRLMQFVDVPAGTAHRLLRVLTGARCGDRVQFDTEELWRVEEMAVQASVDERVDSEEERPTRRTVWSVGTYRTNTNEKLRLIGNNVPDPKTGVLKFQAWRNEKVDQDIDRFALTQEYWRDLEVFQPDPKQTSLEKCMEIAEDLSSNVTRIVGRPELHVGMDLVWHSPLAFRVKGMDVDKGWLDVMVIGDTRTGKSEVATRLMKHYRAGRLISCEGVTFAGLIGGVQQIGNRWHMTWGIIPMNDRRLVVLDEVSGMGEKNIIEQMSSVRSAGVAQITKIHQESTSARTRLIWISNPQSGAFLSEHRQGGLGALQSVVRNNEDLARFDFVMAAARGDVSAEAINAEYEVPEFTEYASEYCEALIKWTWSQTRDTVLISEAAVRAAATNAVKLGRRYSPHPPLIQAENARFKLLRIAASLAARTFSVSRSGGLYVKREHVLSAVEFLDMIYSHEALGYGRASDQEAERVNKSEGQLENAALLLRNNPAVAATLQMSHGEFKVRDFNEFQGVSLEEAQQIVATLYQWGLIKYSGRRGLFNMTPELMDLLRRTEEHGRREEE